MNRTKAIIDFSNYTAAQVGPIAQTIHDKMTENAGTFASPPITMIALQALVTDYDEKLVARASRALADVIALREARRALEEALRVLGGYVNGAAKGDPALVEKSGFPMYGTVRPPDYSPPEAPANLREELERRESETILKVLESVRWNVTQAATQLGVDRTNLHRKMRKYGIHRNTKEDDA